MSKTLDAQPSTPPGPPLSPARTGGGLLFVSGQLALRDGRVVGDDITVQTDIAIGNLRSVLGEHGLDLKDIIRTGVWLTSSENFTAFNLAYRRYFDEPYPARATVISQLALNGALVEIDAVAVLRAR